jgi:hypothetical protein
MVLKQANMAFQKPHSNSGAPKINLENIFSITTTLL